MCNGNLRSIWLAFLLITFSSWARGQTTLEGHDNRVVDFGWSPAGKHAASIDAKGQVMLWNLEEMTSSKLPSDPMDLEKYSTRHIQFSGDGKRLFVGCSRKVRVWDVEAKKSLQVIGNGTDTEALMVSRDGDIALIAEYSTPNTWGAINTADGKEIVQIPIEHYSNSWQLARNGSLFVWPNHIKGFTELFDLRTGQQTGSIRGFKPWTSHSGMALANNDQQLIAIDSDKSQILFWDINDPKNPKLGYQAKMPYVVQGVQTTFDGKTLAVFESRKIHLVDVASRKSRGELVAEPWGFAFCDDGSRLLAHIKDDQYLVADAATGRTIASVSSGQMNNAIRLSPKGDRLAVALGQRIEIRDLAGGKGEDTWKEFAVIPLNDRDQKLFADSHGYSSRLKFAPKGDWLCYSTERASRLISTAAPQKNSVVMSRLTNGEPWPLVARSHYFSEDGKRLLYGSAENLGVGAEHGLLVGEVGAKNTHIVLDLETNKLGKPMVLPMTLEQIWSATDGSKIAASMTVFTGDFRGTPKKTAAFSLVNPNNAQEVKRLLENERPTFAEFSSNNELIAAVVGEEIKVWDTSSFEPVPLLTSGKHYKLGFSHDKKLLYSYDRQAGEVIAYSLDQGQESSRASVKLGHSRQPYDVAFAHRSAMLVTAGENGELVLRSLPDGEIRGRLQGHTHQINAVEFSADDKWLATSDHNGEVRLWQVGPLPASPSASAKSAAITAKPISSDRAVVKKIEPFLISTIKTKLKYPASVGDQYRGMWLRFSPNQQHLCATEIRYGTHCFNVASGQLEQSQTSDPFDAFASADGKWFYHFHHSSQGSYPSILRRSPLGREVSPETLYKPSQEEISSWQLSPDGKSLLLATRYSKDAKSIAVVRMDLTTGKVAATLSGEETHGHLLRFSPDGKTLAALLTVGKESQVALLDPLALTIRSTLTEATMKAWNNSYKERYGLLFSPDGTQLALASEGDNKCVMRIVDVASGKLLSKLERKGVTRPLAFLSNHELVAIVDGKLVTLDLATGLVKTDLNWFEEFGRRALSRDGTLLAEGLDSGEVVFRDLRAEGREISRFKAHDSFVGTLAFSDDGKLLGTMNNENQLKIWSLTGERTTNTPVATTPAKTRLQVKIISDRKEFEAALANPMLVDFDDIKTSSDGAVVEFKSDRYESKGLVINGESGQFVSRTFSYPSNFIPTSKPNSFAPGPKADKNGGKEDGGNQTTVTFLSQAKAASTSGFGLNFIDANYPSYGECKLIAYDAEGLPLGEANDIKTTSGGSLFRGVVVLDESGKPVPAIASVKIINGSGWPELAAAEGVVLDDFIFAPPVEAAP